MNRLTTDRRTLDFSWGNPYFLTEILAKEHSLSHNINDVFSFYFDAAYQNYGGMDECIKEVRKLIKETMGLEYKHIIITNGATHGVNLLLKYYKLIGGMRHVKTYKYGYPFYDQMIEQAGMNRIFVNDPSAVVLTDSPSNPFGESRAEACHIWDAVYHSKIYTKNTNIIPPHEFMVNSVTKTLGFPSARIGFIAFNGDQHYWHLFNLCKNDVSSVSAVSQLLVADIIRSLDLDFFVNDGKRSLDMNRENMSKISYLFDNQPVQENGMFYCAQADKKATEILDKCDIKYLTLDKDYVRISLGQKVLTNEEAVNRILKYDRKK